MMIIRLLHPALQLGGADQLHQRFDLNTATAADLFHLLEQETGFVPSDLDIEIRAHYRITCTTPGTLAELGMSCNGGTPSVLNARLDLHYSRFGPGSYYRNVAFGDFYRADLAARCEELAALDATAPDDAQRSGLARMVASKRALLAQWDSDDMHGVLASHSVPTHAIDAAAPLLLDVSFVQRPFWTYPSDVPEGGAYVVQCLLAAAPARVVVLALAPRLAALPPSELAAALDRERVLDSRQGFDCGAEYAEAWRGFSLEAPLAVALAAAPGAPHVLRVTLPPRALQPGTLYALALLHFSARPPLREFVLLDDMLLPFRTAPAQPAPAPARALPAPAPAAPAPAAPAHLPHPLWSQPVALTGLASRPELNGLRGLVVYFTPASGRLTVLLDASSSGGGGAPPSPTLLKVKPCNVEALALPARRVAAPPLRQPLPI